MIFYIIFQSFFLPPDSESALLADGHLSSPDTCLITVEIEGDSTFCEGDFSTLSVSQFFVSYNWNIGTTSPAITINVEGTYCVTVTDSDGCTGDTCIYVRQLESPFVSILGENVLCDGFTTDLLAYTDAQSVYYEWSTGQTTDGILVSTPGLYCVTVIDENGCYSEACVIVMDFPLPHLEVLAPDVLCPDKFFLVECPDIAVYCELNGSQLTQPLFIGAGAYELEIFFSPGCSVADSFEIDEGHSSEVYIDTALCGLDPMIFQGHIFYDPGEYEIIMQNNAGCDSITHLNVRLVEILDSIAGDARTGTGYIRILDVHEGVPPYQFRWNTGSQSSELKGLFKGIYTVTITDARGCTQIKSYSLPNVNYDWRPDKPTHVFPNPFTDEITIVNELSDGTTWNARIVDAVGTELLSIQTSKSSVNLRIQSGPGIYFVVISDCQGQTQTHKVIDLR